MNDQQLRALVRDAVARHLGRAAASQAGPAPSSPQPPAPFAPPRATSPDQGGHPSHAMYVALVNVGDACLIEPAVACNHCGYCKTHGH